MSAKVPGRGHTHKHVKTSKAGKATAKHRPNHHKKPATHHATGHKVTTKAHHAHHAKAVGFALDGLPVCAFEAVAMSLRLLGQPVSGDEVAYLWELCGSPAGGVPVGEALAAAALSGLGGYRPARVDFVGDLKERGGEFARFAGCEVVDAGFVLQSEDFYRWPVDVRDAPQVAELGRVDGRLVPAEQRGDSLLSHGLILRIDVPGPHAVLATADGWWSWGGRHSPWPCRVSEAWAVSWS